MTTNETFLKSSYNPLRGYGRANRRLLVPNLILALAGLLASLA